MIKDIKFQLSRHTLYISLGLIIIAQLILSYHMELSYDEAYYWIYSKYMDLGYYDHPPMVAWGIWLGELIFPYTELGVRLISNAFLIGTVFILLKLTNHIKNKLIFVFLFIMFPLISLTGIFALPDAGLMFFSTLYFYQLRNFLKNKTVINSFILAAVIALMFYSKYHGLMVVLLTVIAIPKLLREKLFWLTATLVVIFYAPYMFWQYKNDFLTFKFHLFGRKEKHFNISNILDYIGGQWLLMGFLNFALFTKVIKLKNLQDPFRRALWFNSFGFVFFLLLMSFRNQIEANWTITAAIAMFILASYYVDNYKKNIYWFAVPSFFFLLLTRLPLIVPNAFLSLNSNDNRINEIVGWKGNRIPKIQKLCEQRRLVGDNYQITAKVAFYLKKPYIPALHLGSRESQYSLLKLQQNISPDERICYFTSKAKDPNAIKIETNFKDPIYLSKDTSLEELAELYETSYEKIIRK